MLILKKHVVNQKTGASKNDEVGRFILDPEEILAVCEDSFYSSESAMLSGYKSHDNIVSVEVEVAKHETTNCLKIHSYDPNNFVVSLFEKDDQLLVQKNYASKELALILEEYYMRDNEHFLQYLPQVPTVPKGEQQCFVEKLQMDTVLKAKEIVKQVDKLRVKTERPKRNKREPKLKEIIILIIIMISATILSGIY